ncbi:transporter, small conductance mechanosensitive ion channel MscS family protein [Megasphaera vaginalis (ex Srinivasan et al. 2021)]|uniref:Transporter, small conductance mechanosensitive ion channel MscS family protein n=1 Tax=Megasphaera vaginalis (ex Srinivasan et al. 2021) TaxID=1111454 RepID=U7UPJ3_9FIRM|nr:transporter, small conductance mechanosensitive ion channel MscS family protein [Megasphaera vaginalis (ex Srinivasan et al. 2021)]
MPAFFDSLEQEILHGGPHIHLLAFLICLSVGIVVLQYVFRILIVFLSKSRHISEDCLRQIFRAIPTCVGILIGIKIAKWSLTVPDFVQAFLDGLFHTVLTVTVTILIAHVISAYLNYKLDRSSKQYAATSILTTAINCVVYSIGALIVLDSYDISISPLLTAFGVGGLASALALQDTLSNLFSGITMLMSKQIRIGDYIRLATHEEGRVVDLNWRNTTIRTPTGNMVIVPNKTIAASALINYEQPLAECTITIPLKIVYGSDLQHVEQVTLEVAQDVLHHSEYGVTGFQPKIRFTDLGEYGISFLVVLRIRNIVDEATLRHQFIKRIYKKYKEEGIALLIRKD